ncbi:MAG: YicC family protein [Pseudomonadota bacterium]|nr:YicC family protein [Pseudomonadota bacterium]
MAVYSMTGYANTATEAPENGAVLSVEARSVNGRFLDLALRLPDEVRMLEPGLRELLSAAFKRGKIELRINLGGDADTALPLPTPEQLNRLAHQQASVQGWLPEARALSVNEIFQWCRGGARSQRVDEPALAAAKKCIAGLREARAREGARLVAMLQERVATLRALAAQAAPLLPVVVQRQQARFLERWNEALNAVQAGASIPAQALQERALGEAASFAIRIDVAEELSRLSSHLDEIERLLAAGGELGKRLEFLIQELQREANTLGSKSAAIELTALAVEMKVAIEQMREQVQNIE